MPCPVGGEDCTSSNDLVLPFISRMLMEEDIDENFFYQYPDHPALLFPPLPRHPIPPPPTPHF
jgi:hypothetical protein